MPSESPLLTIAIPTYNRSGFLSELLEVLAPQISHEPRVELIISDNASSDNTSAAVDGFASAGMPCRYIRNPVNTGADANFLQCFREARGQYFWLVGDDDILVPGAVAKILDLLSRDEYDIIFVRPYGFHQRFDEKPVHDKLGRTFAAVTDPLLFAEIAGIMLTFISAVIVNKRRFEAIHGAPDPATFVGSNLIQFAWTLPLLSSYRRGLVVFGGLVAGRRANSGGYDLAAVFGRNLKALTLELLNGRGDLSARIINNTLRCWFPGTILEARQQRAGDFTLSDYHRQLSPLFGDNLRYWLYVYPAIKFPVSLASVWVGAQRIFMLRIDSLIQAIRLFAASRQLYPIRGER